MMFLCLIGYSIYFCISKGHESFAPLDKTTSVQSQADAGVEERTSSHTIL